jgi:uncharacterized protein (TIGR02466 family)
MNLAQIFALPMWESSLPNFAEEKDKLLSCVRAFREKHPDGVSKSNVGGYQSPITLTKEPDMAVLFEFIAQIGRKAVFDMQFVDCNVFITAAWVNFHDNRSAVQFEHEHADTFSGVFYLNIPKDSGKLILSNPSVNPLWMGTLLADKKNKFNADKIKLDPVEGHVFVWPSYLPHAVEPNRHDEERISISFNLIALPKEQLTEHTR